jgi:hypothetical protein
MHSIEFSPYTGHPLFMSLLTDLLQPIRKPQRHEELHADPTQPFTPPPPEPSRAEREESDGDGPSLPLNPALA